MRDLWTIHYAAQGDSKSVQKLSREWEKATGASVDEENDVGLFMQKFGGGI